MSNRCYYCGNNPTPHFMQWSSQSLVIVMLPLNRFFARVKLFRAFSRLLDHFFAFWWFLFTKLGVAKFHNERQKSTISRAKVLWEEAERRGIKMRAGLLFGKEIDFYHAEINGKDLYFTGLPRPAEFKDTETEFWIDDKAIVKQKLQAAGVPVAVGGSYSDFRKLRADFESLQKPVIVKPRLGSRGRHTTTHIYTEDQLKKAFDVAKQLCHWVVMEEHLVGDVYRGTVIGGKLAGVLGGSSPRVTGDGVHTIAELIVLKNQNKDPRVKDFNVTTITHEYLSRLGLTLQSILPAGKTIELTEKIGVSYGGTSYEITEETHPLIREVMEKAGAVVGDPLLGFDFIIDNVSESPEGKKWGIIECNGMPFINLHHDPLLGKPNNVARFVWDLHL